MCPLTQLLHAIYTRPQAQTASKQASKNAINLKTDNLTKAKSRNLVKRLTAMTVSTVSYLRNLFPESSFGDKRLEVSSRSPPFRRCVIFT